MLAFLAVFVVGLAFLIVCLAVLDASPKQECFLALYGASSSISDPYSLP